MQVCNILGGQRYSRKLNERQVTNILRLACERPDKREGSIVEVNYLFICMLSGGEFVSCSHLTSLLFTFRYTVFVLVLCFFIMLF